MIRMFQRLISAHRGNVAIEMAIVSPVLVFMALGAFDFGMAYSVQTSYEAAVRAGYEYAFTNTDVTAIAARVTANLDSTMVQAGYPSVSLVYECSNGTAATSSTICGGSISAPYQYINIKVRGQYALLFDWPFVSATATCPAGNLCLEQEGRVRVK